MLITLLLFDRLRSWWILGLLKLSSCSTLFFTAGSCDHARLLTAHQVSWWWVLMWTIFHSPFSSCSLLPRDNPDTLNTSEPNHSHAHNPLCGLHFCHQSHPKVPEDPGVLSSSIWFFIIYNPGETQGHVLSPFLYPNVLARPSARTWSTPVLLLEGSLSRIPSTFQFSSHIFSVIELPPDFTAKTKSYKHGNSVGIKGGRNRCEENGVRAQLH